MPVHKSAVKRIRTSQKKHARNLAIQSELKTVLKKLDGLISSNKADQAKELIQQAMVKLDIAASKGAIHKKRASRKKSRLTKKLNKLKTA